MTDLTISPSRKLPDRIIELKSPNTTEQSTKKEAYHEGVPIKRVGSSKSTKF